MLDIKLIRENPAKVAEGLGKRNGSHDVEALLKLDREHRALLRELEDKRAWQKQASRQARGETPQLQELKSSIQELGRREKELAREITDVLLKFPNLPLEQVPVGKTEAGNVVLREWGTKPRFDFPPKDYLTLGQALDVIDVERAAKVSGSRFGYLKNEAAFLELALAHYAVQTLANPATIAEILARAPELGGLAAKPFRPVIPPVMLKPEVFGKMARLDPAEDRYYIPGDDLYLAGSAEHTLGPLHMDETFREAGLPVRYVGFSTCFRREAGSYGKDTKGILRVHQFDKVEMESFCLPELSGKEHEFLVACQEYLMQTLELPYRVVEICTGDMGAPDARQIDLETWLPGQGTYRETHSADLTTDYQARRLQTRVRRRDGRTELVHMADATAFAIGRTLIAILENYQTPEGGVRMPKALQAYLPFASIPAASH